MFAVFMPISTTVRFRGAFALALIVVTALALDPAPDLPITLWDKASHALAYFFLAYLGDRSFPSATGKRPGLAVFLGLFAYGIAIEALQSQIPSREASLLDLLANGSGLALYAGARTLTVVSHD